MMLTLLNPHADDFIAGPVSFKLAKRRALKKYSYLLSEQVTRFGYVNILIDGTLSSLFPQTVFSVFPKTLRRLILKWEIKQWLTLNALEDKVRVHWSPDTIEDKSKLYLFSYKNCTGAFDERIEMIEAFDTKIINLSHFMIRTREKGENAQRIRNVIYTSEANLSDTDFFTTYFGYNQKVIALPFMVADRFKRNVDHSDRSDRCAATGSFHALQYEKPHHYYSDFMNFFDEDTYHPIRKSLYHQRDEIKEFIESRISPYREKGHKLLSRLDIGQKQYFSFDVVEFYNQYKYALIGEEIHGLAAIGSFEAMACGCTLIGSKGNFYNGLGLERGIHYVEHDGTFESIKSAITFLRENPSKASEIAENGYQYANTFCNAPALWDLLIDQIEHSVDG
jgi:glycosyltransferase involved in cell wall biosynthesis